MSIAEKNTSEAILTVENITLSFGAVRAIRDVSFNIKKSEISLKELPKPPKGCKINKYDVIIEIE